VKASGTIGGGTRTEEITRPRIKHDVCWAVQSMSVLSTYWRTLRLERYGLDWIEPELSVAHPFDGGRARALATSLDETARIFEAAGCGHDVEPWRKMVTPLVSRNADALLADILGPFGLPRRPLAMARFGM